MFTLSFRPDGTASVAFYAREPVLHRRGYNTPWHLRAYRLKYHMVLNPILMIVFTGVSLLGGIVGLTQTDSLWSVVPFAVFAFLFCLSLLKKV